MGFMGSVQQIFCHDIILLYGKEENNMVTLLLAIIYLAFISLGLPDSLLGS